MYRNINKTISSNIPACSSLLSVALIASMVSACSNLPLVESVNENASTLFVEAKDAIEFDHIKRRKWDAPVIADLDQDGQQDILIVEHGFQLKVFWNTGGRFSKPSVIAKGDLHGLAVADYDADGRLDLIVAQGGGDGKNPKRPIHYSFGTDRSIKNHGAFEHFELGRGRSIKFIDSGRDHTIDLLVTGFPLKSQTEGANHFYHSTKSGESEFTFAQTLPQAKWLGYRVLTTDVDLDGYTDLLFYGGADVVLVKGDGQGSFVDASDELPKSVRNISDVSSLSEIDYDNDGDFDLFVTRSEPQFELERYYEKESGRFAFLTFRKPFLFDDLIIEGDLKIENLQRTYQDRNVYVGKNKRELIFDGDPHGHQDVTIRAEDAFGWPEEPLPRGVTIGYLGSNKWRIGGHTHSRTAALISKVVSVPTTDTQSLLPARLWENRDGKFVDVTPKSGIHISEQTTGAAVGDFDNNGWSDLAVLRYGSMAKFNEHIIYLNQGGGRFIKADKPGLVADEVGTTGGSIGVLDFDSNGWLDILFSNERGRWHLLRNTLNSDKADNAFLVVRIGKSPLKKISAFNAVLTLNACGHIYRRKVGASSAAFSQGLNTELHVGLGACPKVDSAVVEWRNGERYQLREPAPSTIVDTP